MDNFNPVYLKQEKKTIEDQIHKLNLSLIRINQKIWEAETRNYYTIRKIPTSGNIRTSTHGLFSSLERARSFIPKNRSYNEDTKESSEYTIEIVKKDPEWGILDLDFSKLDKEPTDFPGNVVFFSGTGTGSGRYK